ncbi:hypothetical protein [Tengunoibacter tsumagoiensis]|uniref:RND efflux pump membrane fusion protein barrel-sandwich domain-containing protein n=1 Tax=Tengunoibacter tsumagoiensis TaxID=2014871 RepID=A0A402A3M2_9CHLR|nr:hypothetical protein [Tengunoibacter tsumagoiensis]GCE13649.1 hypothetical protein KTT_35080 [Tengunoibacter tsumagoiensis]
MPAQRQLFREQALKYYMQKKERDVLPRLITPPFFICTWILFGLCVLALVIAWESKVPQYVAATGLIEQSTTSVTGASETSRASETAKFRLFVPSAYASRLHPGERVEIQIGADNTHMLATVREVTSEVLGPVEAQKRYHLSSNEAQSLQQPVVTLLVQPQKPLSTHAYVGSQVKAQVQVGEQNVLSLLPEINQLIGR